MTKQTATAMRTAAEVLIESLDEGQRAIALWPFPSDDERRRWFYTPTNHGGLPLADMTPGQHRLTHRLVASGLSTAGYVTAAAIMGLENILDHTEGWTAGFERERGRDPLLYYVTIFGSPDDSVWSWRFGGHHISIHHTIAAGRVVSSTPNFFGADPAASPLLGPHPHRPLAGIEDLGLELINALDGDQRSRALVSNVAPSDLVGANRTVLRDGDRPMSVADVWRKRFEGELGRAIDAMQVRADHELGITETQLEAVSFTRVPKGLASPALTGDQRQILDSLVACFLDRLPEDLADRQKANVSRHFDSLHFAWAGGTERGRPHYYRVHGGDVLIEYDNTQRGANHVHSVWRDLAADFGADALAAHYASHHD